MDEIELVVKIDKDIYEARQHWAANPKRMIDKVDMAIANGTPLPKGHGRIVDVDKMLDEMRATRTYNILFALERVKPIIKADKENKKN